MMEICWGLVFYVTNSDESFYDCINVFKINVTTVEQATELDTLLVHLDSSSLLTLLNQILVESTRT